MKTYIDLKYLTDISNKIESVMAHDNNFVSLTRMLNKLVPNAKFYNEKSVPVSIEKTINDLIISVSEEFDKYYSVYCEEISKFQVVGSFYVAFMNEKKKIELL
ncbi:hypothetical protein D3C87_1286380 [compost metagenome]